MALRFCKYIVSFSVCLLLLASCNSDEEDFESIAVSNDALLVYFSLSSDSISGLSSVAFSINQKYKDDGSGIIYNYDSLEYGTEFPRKIRLRYTTAVADATVRVKIDDEFEKFSSGDSININDFLKDPMLEVTSQDGEVKKQYHIQINIHQMDADSIHYKEVASALSFLNADEVKVVSSEDAYYTFTKNFTTLSLYESQDMVGWVNIPTLTGLPADVNLYTLCQSVDKAYVATNSGDLYVSNSISEWRSLGSLWEQVSVGLPVKALLGYLYKNPYRETGGVSLIVEKDGASVFAFNPEETIDLLLGGNIAVGFPIANYATINYSSMNVHRVTVVGGENESGELLNTVWSTQNGVSWTKINADKSNVSFPKLRGMNAFFYDGKFYIINGLLESGELNGKVYSSRDEGNTWKVEGKEQFTSFYPQRHHASVMVGREEIYFYLVGGKNSDGNLTNIWQGNKNELLFEK